MNPWLCLAAAIVLETTGTFMLKLSDGFEKQTYGWLAIGLYSACFWVLAPALKVIPVGVAYSIWAGVGIAAAALIGFVLFHERLGALQLGFIGLIVVGAVGLRLTTNA